MSVFSFICPTQPERPPYNTLVGNIVKINESQGDLPLSLNMIRISVEGTNSFAMAGNDGYFYLSDIQANKIKLRFEYSGRYAYYDLGEIGFNNQVDLKDITIGYGRVYVEMKEIRPFQAIKNTGTAS